MIQRIEKILRLLQLDVRYYLKNATWVVIRQIGVMAVALVLSIILTRITSKEIYGNYQFMISAVAMATIFSLPGLQTSLIREVAQGFYGAYRSTMRTSARWSLIGSLVLLGVGAYYAQSSHSEMAVAFVLASAFFPLLFSTTVWDSFLQAASLFNVYSRFSLAQSVFSAAVICGTAYFSHGNFLLLFSAYLATQAGFNLLWYFKTKKYATNERTREGSLQYGKFLTLINLLNVLAARLDILLVGILAGPEELAVYAIGINLARNLYNFQKSSATILTPNVARKNTITRKNYLLLFLVGLGLAVISIILTPFVVNIFYPSDYALASPIAQVALLFLPFALMHLMYNTHSVLRSANKRLITLYSIITTVARLTLIIAGYSFFGTIGLAFAFGAQHIVGIFVLHILHGRIKGAPSEATSSSQE